MVRPQSVRLVYLLQSPFVEQSALILCLRVSFVELAVKKYGNSSLLLQTSQWQNEVDKQQASQPAALRPSHSTRKEHKHNKKQASQPAALHPSRSVRKAHKHRPSKRGKAPVKWSEAEKELLMQQVAGDEQLQHTKITSRIFCSTWFALTTKVLL